jgi:hypothetical protein
MQFSDIFAAYYIEFRGDSDVPTDTTDPEWIIGMAYCNQAINRWKQVDGVLWNELWTTRNTADDGDDTVEVGTLEYETPEDFVMPGGYVRLGGNASGQGNTSSLQP